MCKQNKLEKLFDAQIATLENRRTPEQIVEILQGKKETVVQKAIGMTIGEGNIPFLPVIKPVHLGYYGLMDMVRNGGKAGFIYLNPTQIFDVVDTPQGLYYSYDVEDGSNTCNESPESAEEIFKQQKRFRFMVAEIAALTIHTDVLLRHNVWATGSRCGFVGGVPFIYIDYDGRPSLNCFHISNSSGLWGSPSCGSR